jgi:hypothetical protein
VRGYGNVERSAGTIALVQRMTGRLLADGVPVELFASVHAGRFAAQLDVLDVLLAAGVPVVLPPALLSGFDVNHWFEDRSPGERELAAVAADARLRPVLRRAVGESRGRRHGRPSRPVQSVPVLAELLGEWVEEQVALLEGGAGLAGAHRT